MKTLKNWLLNLYNHPVGIWCLAFLIINIAFRGTGGANPASRFATMRAIVEQGSFEISSYRHWSVDWAQKEEGKYFSNKAPGPMFIGLPVFFILEKLTAKSKKANFNEKGHRIDYISSTPRVIMSLLTQLIPFAIVCFLILKELKLNNFWHLIFATGSLFFGTTISHLLNVYFGHGMTSIFILLIALGLLKENYFLIGIGFGFSLLCEYTTALLIFPLSIILINRIRLNYKEYLIFIFGGAPAGILWIIYHLNTTGSIFETVSSYQNPAFLTLKNDPSSIRGLFHSFPQFDVLLKLLFGYERGLLFTQPWVLVFFIIPLINFKKITEHMVYKEIFFLSYIGLIIYLIFNSMFDEWHSGWMIGPRYISSILPLVAVSTTLYFNDLNPMIRNILMFGLSVAIVFKILVYTTTILAPDVPLWPYLISKIEVRYLLRIPIFLLIIFGTIIKSKKNLEGSKLEK